MATRLQLSDLLNSAYASDRHMPFTLGRQFENSETGEPCEECNTPTIYNANTGRWWCPECHPID